MDTGPIVNMFTRLITVGTTIALIACAFFVMLAGYQHMTRAAAFSNPDGLFALHTSAEDARYLAAERGGGLDEQDVLELGHFQAYARLSDMRTGERLPAFIVQLDPPPPQSTLLD